MRQAASAANKFHPSFQRRPAVIPTLRTNPHGIRTLGQTLKNSGICGLIQLFQGEKVKFEEDKLVAPVGWFHRQIPAGGPAPTRMSSCKIDHTLRDLDNDRFIHTRAQIHSNRSTPTVAFIVDDKRPRVSRKAIS